MTKVGRTAALLLFAGGLAFVIWRWCGDHACDLPVPGPSADGSARPAPEPPHPPPSRADRRARDAAASPEGATPVTGPEVDGFPAIDVEVVNADGTPAANAEVYALEAGAPGRERRDAGPFARTDAQGRCRMVLPREGSYDVGAVRDASRVCSAMERDVVLPRAAALRIALRATSAVTFVSELKRPYTVWIGSDAAGPRKRSAPGRADAWNWSLLVSSAADAAEFAVQVPADVPGRVWASPDIRASPETFTAPATVRLSPTQLIPIGLRLGFGPPERVNTARGWVAVELDAGAGAPRVTPIAVRFTDGRPPNSETRTIWLPPGETKVRWHGHGVVSGEHVFTGATPGLVPDERVESDVVLLDGSALPPVPPEGCGTTVPQEIEIRVANPLPADASWSYCLAPAHARGGRGTTRVGGTTSCGVTDAAWIAASSGDLFAGPQKPTLGADGTYTLTMAPGGWLVLDVEEPPPPSALGPYTIERADGVPLVFTNRDLPGPFNWDMFDTVDVTTRTTLGPLPPCEIEFVVRVGGIEVGRVRGTVRAGETEALHLPQVRPR